MSLVKKLPPPPSISKVNAHNKELLCLGRGWGKAGGHLFYVVKSYKGIGLGLSAMDGFGVRIIRTGRFKGSLISSVLPLFMVPFFFPQVN